MDMALGTGDLSGDPSERLGTVNQDLELTAPARLRHTAGPDPGVPWVENL
jgi:hypothetical protein